MHARASVGNDVINYATKHASNAKVKFSELSLSEKQRIANHELITASSGKTICYLSKIKLKSNCRQESAVVRAQNKLGSITSRCSGKEPALLRTSARDANILLTGEVTGKDVTGIIFKDDE